MIKGIGLDIVETGRIQRMIERQPKFVKRILTAKEEDAFCTLNEQRKVEFAAGRFAAKEAFAKANGTGIGTALSFQDIEISKDPNGKPYFSKPEGANTHLSITHSREFAAAQVIIEE
ncbi:holo-ACP synthase [Rossellomorea aquimaris]|uniref:Holo-[acyl-carrier-protein] synthase n=1 Tax=Rossellomorea aquimaris TaxID=189382 RepID=A0A5D4TFS0_9BACI|nr:holo-ACP synthase [Rossellomorea aquimaris]TYS74049.1 holo-ACP synthase [Rossellomorea aquimaris]TYS78628.1 holo-ACP synthase [Rossellomorea aquimaris]